MATLGGGRGGSGHNGCGVWLWTLCLQRERRWEVIIKVQLCRLEWNGWTEVIELLLALLCAVFRSTV